MWITFHCFRDFSASAIKVAIKASDFVLYIFVRDFLVSTHLYDIMIGYVLNDRAFICVNPGGILIEHSCFSSFLKLHLYFLVFLLLGHHGPQYNE